VGDPLREFNRSRVLAAVRAGSATSRTELVAATGLARSTVTAIVAELLAAHTLIETDLPADVRRTGRPARGLRPAPRQDLVAAVDFGHSHCRVGVVDSQARIIADETTAMDVDSSPQAALDHAGAALARVLERVDRDRVVGVGVGLPAPVNSVTGTVGPGNVLPSWVACHPGDELGAWLALPVTVDNDANLGAVAEVSYGAARGLSDVIYVKASAGIGAGFVLGGRLFRGSTGRAGEIGHVPVDPNGPLCRCGNRGCLETLASITQVITTMQPPHDDPLTVARVTELVAAGDAGAMRVLGDTGRAIGRVLADVVNNLNPELVVLGGELSLAGAPVLDGVREAIDRHCQPGIARDVRVEISQLGADAQLLGAAAVALALADATP
jgi:predicted NBD/HSP70 family sugar kinase